MSKRFALALPALALPAFALVLAATAGPAAALDTVTGKGVGVCVGEGPDASNYVSAFFKGDGAQTNAYVTAFTAYLSQKVGTTVDASDVQCGVFADKAAAETGVRAFSMAGGGADATKVPTDWKPAGS